MGLNNHVWLYSAHDGRPLRKLQFVGSVESVALNESHVAALVNGKVYLQTVNLSIRCLKGLVAYCLSCRFLLLNRH